MMTSEGARAVGLQGAIGALAPGEWADLVIFDTEGRTALDQILERTALRQTLAVMIGGRIASAPQAWAWPVATAGSMRQRTTRPVWIAQDGRRRQRPAADRTTAPPIHLPDRRPQDL